jgi:hypothetical protein
MSIRKDLLRDIEAFLRDFEMAASTFGAEAISDRAFVFMLRAGRDPKASTVDRVRDFMADYRRQHAKRPKLADAAA